MDKVNQLKKLIRMSVLSQQQKTNKIIQTLQKTEDILKAKLLVEKIQNGDFSHLRERTIYDLIEAFNTNEDVRNTVEEITYKDISKDNALISSKDQNLEYENKLLKKQLEFAENRYKELEQVNKRIVKKISLTQNEELITVPDEDINELYLERLSKNSEINSCREAFVVNGVIPKTYYVINKS